MCSSKKLWFLWTFEGDNLIDINVNSSKWQRFKDFLTQEKKEALSEYPPDQLDTMRSLVESKEEDEDNV